MRKRLLFIICVLGSCVFLGCVKDLKKVGVSETTMLMGRVLEESERTPVSDVQVSVTNGSTVYLSTTTNANGMFSLEVDFSLIDEDSFVFLKMSYGSKDITKRLELKGMGKETWNYNDVFLYDKTHYVVPVVSTNSVSNIGTYSAVCGGSVTSQGSSPVTERGICLSQTQNPTMSDRTIEGGEGTGSFSCYIDGLLPGTVYYVCAYAVNDAGEAYGTTKSFTTLAEANDGDTFNVDFENGLPSGWKVIDGNNDGWTWCLTSTIPATWSYYANLTLTWYHSGSNAICSGSFINDVGALSPDEYIVSPKVNIANGSTFSFWAAAADADYPSDHFGVFVSNNGVSNWTLVQEWTLTSKSDTKAGDAHALRYGKGKSGMGSWHHYSVDLSAYKGQKYIAIRHFNSYDQYIICVDDITLTND